MDRSALHSLHETFVSRSRESRLGIHLKPYSVGCDVHVHGLSAILIRRVARGRCARAALVIIVDRASRVGATRTEPGYDYDGCERTWSVRCKVLGPRRDGPGRLATRRFDFLWFDHTSPGISPQHPRYYTHQNCDAIVRFYTSIEIAIATSFRT